MFHGRRVRVHDGVHGRRRRPGAVGIRRLFVDLTRRVTVRHFRDEVEARSLLGVTRLDRHRSGGRLFERFGNDDADGLAVVANLGVLQQRQDTPGGRVDTRASAVGQARRVILRHFEQYTGHPRCRRGIDREDPPFRNRRQHEHGMGEAREFQVADVRDSSRHLRRPLHAVDACADHVHDSARCEMHTFGIIVM